MKHVLRGCMLAAAMLMALPGPVRAAGMGDMGDMGDMGSFGIHPYIGVGVGVYDLNFKGSGLAMSNNVAGGFVKLGADFNEYLGAELRVGATDRGKRNFPTGYYQQRARYLFSYLAKLQLPVTQQLRVYGLVGGTTGNLSFLTGAGQLAGKVATGVSFGGGFDYQVDDFTRVGLEYMRYWNGVGVNKAGAASATENADSYVATLQIAM
jgi:hypothetical protein